MGEAEQGHGGDEIDCGREQEPAVVGVEGRGQHPLRWNGGVVIIAGYSILQLGQGPGAGEDLHLTSVARQFDRGIGVIVGKGLGSRVRAGVGRLAGGLRQQRYLLTSEGDGQSSDFQVLGRNQADVGAAVLGPRQEGEIDRVGPRTGNEDGSERLSYSESRPVGALEP